jgi:hypothetical protein
VNKSIAQLLAHNRARNDASNRSEFLHPVKRRRLSADKDGQEEVDTASAARTDAKSIDRDIMMKFDIAKNDEGPLRRTVRDTGKDNLVEASQPVPLLKSSNEWFNDRYPGLSERLKNLETHLAVRYGASARAHKYPC